MEIDSSTISVVETVYSFGSGLKKNECAIIAQRHRFMDRDRNGGGLSSMTRTLAYAHKEIGNPQPTSFQFKFSSPSEKTLLFNSTWQSNFSRVTSHSPLEIAEYLSLWLYYLSLYFELLCSYFLRCGRCIEAEFMVLAEEDRTLSGAVPKNIDVLPKPKSLVHNSRPCA